MCNAKNLLIPNMNKKLMTSQKPQMTNVPERKSVPRKRISKKPLKYSTDEYTSESEPEENTTTANKLTQNRKSPNIAHWLLKLIEQKSSAIGWTGRDREFKILDQKKLAKMCGERQGNNRMTYNNVA